jgi:hypothetical protein
MQNAYANWVQIGEQAQFLCWSRIYTKSKGSRNYSKFIIFIGKPNNGNIATNTVNADHHYWLEILSFSALDLKAFIK